MTLGTDYAGQDCSLARALEVVGDRWTLLILRDALFGVHRFSDFASHLDVSRAVLSQRLARLVETGLLARVGDDGSHQSYEPTDAALRLWPAMHALARWGEQQVPASSPGPRRVFEHATCGRRLDVTGRCDRCDVVPAPQDVLTRPGPGADPSVRDDAVSVALRSPRRLLDPVGA
jgi:DNA-binding HxlR family transcriptional regulator